MPIDLDNLFQARLASHMDRLSSDAVTYGKTLEFGYLGSQQFRDATAARMVTEAGSGRTRAETNNPAETAVGTVAPKV